ncbi:MAG: hypothetical protein ACI8RZ_001858 [Myxococcota bacterium]|jgi:hypothetical protein
MSTLHPAEIVVTVSTVSVVDPQTDDLIQLHMEIPDPPEGCHIIPLSITEAEAVLGMLASGGQLHDDDGPWLTIAPGGTSLTMLPEAWCYTGLHSLEQALHQALTVLVTHPPRLCALDPCIGEVQAIDSTGTLQRIAVTVQAEVSDPGTPRVMIDWVGTWWLTVPEVLVLAEVLPGDDISLRADSDPTVPWLVVRQESDRVFFQLCDSLVTEDGEDGVLWLSKPAAADLSAILTAALAWAQAHSPRIFVPPEPGPREVMRVPL